MGRRTVLTGRQRDALLALPADEPTLLQHHLLNDVDLGHIRRRRRPQNRLGFALQLCAFRYPGRGALLGGNRGHRGSGYRHCPRRNSGRRTAVQLGDLKERLFASRLSVLLNKKSAGGCGLVTASNTRDTG
jgi:Domain of unknown function (DUF4158)